MADAQVLDGQALRKIQEKKPSGRRHKARKLRRRTDDDSLTLSFETYRGDHDRDLTYNLSSGFDDRYDSWLSYSDYTNYGISHIGPGISTEYIPGAYPGGKMALPIKPMWKIGPTGRKMMVLPNQFWANHAKNAKNDVSFQFFGCDSNFVKGLKPPEPQQKKHTYCCKLS